MKLLSALSLLAAATIGTASATTIQYNTTGSYFTSIGGVATAGTPISFSSTTGAGNVTLSYANITGGSFDNAVGLTGINLGLFTATYMGPAAPNDVAVVIPSFTFRLLFNDTTVGNGNVSTVITGSSAGGNISQNNSSVLISYAPLNFTEGTTSPNFVQIQSPTIIVAPLSGLNGSTGQTTVQGLAMGTTTAMPEPGSMFLMGAGLIGVGFTARKKFAARS